MKIDTFTAFTVTSMIALSVAFFSMRAEAAERYMHKCSSNKLKPTLIDETRPLRRSTVSLETRRYYPGVRPNINIINMANGEQLLEARFVYKAELKRCVYKNKYGTVAKNK